jgi:hypothetical protein
MASFEDVRRYQLHLAASGVGVPTINQTVSTLRFFFRVTLRRYERPGVVCSALTPGLRNGYAVPSRIPRFGNLQF